MKQGQLAIESFQEYDQFSRFPGTRYMGSKNKIIQSIWNILKEYPFESFLDAFGGSNVVGYFMKCRGKRVLSNDFMAISHQQAKAIIENSAVRLLEGDIDFLLTNENREDFVSRTFSGLYFSDEENRFIDLVRSNIALLDDEYKRALAMSALVRACMKKRPRGIFTFVGSRYDDGRKDIHKSISEHFTGQIAAFNMAVFDNSTQCMALHSDVQDMEVEADLIYLDPPYFTPNSDNDYVRRYHFVEGLARNWEGVEIQPHTKTKKFKSYESPFAKRDTAFAAFEGLISSHQKSIIAISYSSNSQPTKEELLALLGKYKKRVEVHEIDHLYSFGNQNHKAGNGNNRVKEYLFIGN